MTEKELEKKILKLLDERLEVKQRMTFNDMENLLSYVPYYEQMIKNLKEKITLLDNGVDEPVSATENLGIQTSKTYTSNIERREEQKARYMERKDKIERLLNLINDSMNVLSNEKYIDILRLKYIEKKTVKEITETLHISESSYKREKSKLVNLMVIMIFPESVHL